MQTFDIRINRYQRDLLRKALTLAPADQFSEQAGTGNKDQGGWDTENKELWALAEMLDSLITAKGRPPTKNVPLYDFTA